MQDSALDHDFVDKDIYQYSKEAIDTVAGVLNESEKQNLINKYLSYERLNQSGYARNYENMYNELSKLYLNEKIKFLYVILTI